MMDDRTLNGGSRRNLGCVVFLASLAACGGGGGPGGDGRQPTLVAAIHVGSSTAAASGDALLLVFSEPVNVIGSTLLDDADLVLAPSGTLGTVTTLPTLDNDRTVRVIVGNGVSFTSGADTIGIIDGIDGVADLSGLAPLATAPVAISSGDGDAPVVSFLTLNGIPAALNGTGSAGGTLQVPRGGFTIDAAWSDATSPINGLSSLITADVPVGTPSGTVPSGENLVSQLTGTFTASTGSFVVPTTFAFPEAPVTVSLYARDTSGQLSAPATFSFRVRAITDALRPFETNVNAQQVWFLDRSRDIESFSVNLANAATPVEVSSSANGRSDIEDLFLVTGLLSSTPIPNVLSGQNSNDLVLVRFDAALTGRPSTLYEDTKVNFVLTSPGAFPNASSVPYNQATFSRICLAGAERPSGTSGILGIAIYDPHNATQNDNCLTDFLGTQRLGIFLHTLVNAGFQEPGISLFRTTYDPFTPARGGTAIGDDASDGARLLDPSFDARAATMDAAIVAMAQAAAIIVAHECGHSMGLVVDGAMPAGLYGDMSAFFAGSTSGHIRNAALFPVGSTNVMSPALSFQAMQSTFTAFNDLNLAFLMEQVLHDEQ